MFDENWQDEDVAKLNEMMKYIRNERLLKKINKYIELQYIPKRKVKRFVRQINKEYTKNKNKRILI